MAKIVCKKCGLTGWSKCPYCRSVFGDDQTLAMVESRVRVSKNDVGPIVTLQCYEDEKPEEDLPRLLGMVNLKQLFCVHQLEFAEGAKSEIGCGHTS